MLTLNTPNRELSRTIPQENRVIHGNFFGERFNNTAGYIGSIGVSDSQLPYIFRGKKIQQRTYSLNVREEIDSLVTDLNNSIENLSENELGLYMLYGSYDLFEPVQTKLNEQETNNLIELPEELDNYYKKCLEQFDLREYNNNATQYKVLYNVEKHVVLIMSNHYDHQQASLYYLTLGLIPKMFTDIAECFNETEMIYFNELVHRSQLKRITNQLVFNLFCDLVIIPEYLDKLEELQFDNSVQGLINSRLYTTQNRIDEHNRNALRALDTYKEEQAKYYEATRLLTTLQSCKETAIDEIKLALKTEGVHKTKFYNDRLTITVVTPLKFYESDEAELVIHNSVHDPFLKWLFEKVFINQELKLRLVAKFLFSFTDNRGDLVTNLSIDETAGINAMFNPHLFYFNCLGDYKPALTNAIAKQDLLMFVNTAIASTGSINFRDGAVTGRWINDLAKLVSHQRNHRLEVYWDRKCFYNDTEEYSLRDLYEQYEHRNDPVEEVVSTATTDETVTFTVNLGDRTFNITDADVVAAAPALTITDTVTDITDADVTEEGDDWLE